QDPPRRAGACRGARHRAIVAATATRTGGAAMHCPRPRLFGLPFLRGGARYVALAALSAALVGAAPDGFAQPKAIKFGAIYIMSGSAAAYGPFAKQGLQLAA